MKLAHILVVEDTPSDRELLRQFFKREKFCNRLYFAHNAEQAEQKLQQHTIDLILVDVNLPDENGIAFARRINRGRTEKLPIVCLSGNSNLETLQQAEQANVLAFVEKPLTFPLLRQLMRKVTQLHLGLMLEEGNEQ